ncbi:cobalt transporter CbiM [candidate division KSB3 bacterium]|uniref:Cobalt transporter CbiM n=1 Tax=candidate division KSB3 bacterium TaxID=2044937 RepID=A0A9D5Q8H9_9BACT|nr:cobalt transporter CbiM [candidate division KSB3 bacterium]
MHIPDGVLATPVLITTGIVAAGGVANGLRKIDYEEVPKVAVLSAAFFVASLIHIPIGPASAHLLLNGLLGVLIGWAAFPALLIGLVLQALFFGFGGVTSLGTNVVNMAAPAVLVYALFATRINQASSQKALFVLGWAAGAIAILTTCGLGAVTLFASGKEFAVAITAILIAHLPIILIEGFVTGSVMVFLHKVRPELLQAPLLYAGREEKLYA